MKWSIPLGRVLGIRLGIHATFFLVIAWVAWLGWQYDGFSASLWAVAMICLLFVCVVLHELGHCAVAMRFGIGVDSITLLPVGGVAAMKSMPEEPLRELLIAIAGPLVNVGILAVLIPLKGFPSWNNIVPIPGSLAELVDSVIRANMILIFFNMLPAFPMDGGRVLRALLAMVVPYPRATAWAAGIGRVVAVLFVLLGASINPFLVVIGVFVFIGAGGENRMVQVKAAMAGVPARRLMRPPPPRIRPDEPLRTCLERFHYDDERFFLVQDEQGLRGILPMSAWRQGIQRAGLDAPAGDCMIGRFISFPPDITLDAVIQEVSALPQEVFPVLAGGQVQGVIVWADVRDFIFKTTGRGRPAAARPPAVAAYTRPRPFSIDLG
jgi:Zn-dependent protease